MNKNSKLKEYYPFFVFAIIFITAQSFISIYPGDDTYFVDTVSKSKSVIDFVVMRYENWSGRVVSEFLISVFSILNLWVWKVINCLVVFGFIYCISKLIKLTQIKMDIISKTQINSFVCLSFFMIPISVTTRSCSWFTGSFFYLWPTFACIIGIMPFVYKIYGKSVSKLYYFISILATIYASYIEQTGAFLICFGFITLLYLYIRDRRFHFILFLEVLISIPNFIISILAPGNSVRFISEIKTWYPNFNNLSLIQKLSQGISWTHLHLIRDNTIMMLVLSLLLFIIFTKMHSKPLIRVFAFIPSLYFLGSFIPFNKIVSGTTSYEYNYDVEKILGKIFFDPMQSILPLSISCLIVFSIIILLFTCIKNKNDKYLCIIIYLASMASGYILGFSPTIFGSGPRIFFMTDILLVTISGILLKTMLEEVVLNKMLWRISCISYSTLAGIYALIYVGGIALKTIYKIE